MTKIKKAGRRLLKPGKYRRLMQTRFNKKVYGQHRQCETVVSMIKRHRGDAQSKDYLFASHSTARQFSREQL